MILIDIGPIVAIFDKDDRYHKTCVEILKKMQSPLITTWPVVTECFYLLSFSWEVQDDLWTFIRRGGIEIHALDRNLFSRCQDLMKQYNDLPMDLADATLVTLAESFGISKMFTLDHKDFSAYRFKQKKRFTLVPSALNA